MIYPEKHRFSGTPIPRSPHLTVFRCFERSEEQAKPKNWRKTEGFLPSTRDNQSVAAFYFL